MAVSKGQNGAQVAQHNLEIFSGWAAAQSHDDFIQIIRQGKLNRRDMAAACGFGTSVFSQNKSVRAELKKLEDRLRADGVLPPIVVKASDKESKQYDNSSRKLAKLASHNGNLERENIELKAKIKLLEAKLERFCELNETLAEMGFMQR